MPSHSVTVTRTTTTSSSSAIILNIGSLTSLPGIIKLLQLIVGIIVVGILSHYSIYWSYGRGYYYDYRADLFYILVAVAFFVTTFLLILAGVISLATATILPKTVFEYIYHGTAFLLYLIGAIVYLAELVKRNDRYGKEYGYEAKMAAAVMGFINSGLYLFSAIMAYRVSRVG